MLKEGKDKSAQQSEELVGGQCVNFNGVAGILGTACCEDVVQSQEWESDYFLRHFDDPLDAFAVHVCAD